MRRVRRLKELASSCAPVVSQWAGVAALEGPQDAVEEYRRVYEGRRRVLLDGLDRIGFTYGDPRGAFYVFLNASSVGMDSIDLSRKLLEEARVLIFPGTGFGEQWVDYMRVSYLAPEAEVAEAMGVVVRSTSVRGRCGAPAPSPPIASSASDARPALGGGSRDVSPVARRAPSGGAPAAPRTEWVSSRSARARSFAAHGSDRRSQRLRSAPGASHSARATTPFRPTTPRDTVVATSPADCASSRATKRAAPVSTWTIVVSSECRARGRPGPS
jgi:hypothetical protein